jgi:hypothetical protein
MVNLKASFLFSAGLVQYRKKRMKQREKPAKSSLVTLLKKCNRKFF